MKTRVIGRSGVACCATSLLGGIASVMAMRSAGAAVVYHSSTRSVTWLPINCACQDIGTCPPEQISAGGTALFCTSTGVVSCGSADQCSELRTTGIFARGHAIGDRQSLGNLGGGRSDFSAHFSVTVPTPMVLAGSLSAIPLGFQPGSCSAFVSFLANGVQQQSWSVQSGNILSVDYTTVLQPGITYSIVASGQAGSPGNGGSGSMGLWSFTAGMPRLCDNLDFNRDGILGDPTDIEAFISVYSGGPCIGSNFCGDLDFNNDGIVQDPTDIESFLSVYSGGPCL